MTLSASSLVLKYPRGKRSTPTIEMYTRCGGPAFDDCASDDWACDAARTRFRVASASPFLLLAQCTIVPAPCTAAARPPPVARSPVTNTRPSWLLPLRRLSTRTSPPAPRSRDTTCWPSVPVPPVTRMGDDGIEYSSTSARSASHRPLIGQTTSSSESVWIGVPSGTDRAIRVDADRCGGVNCSRAVANCPE